uniref:Transposable element Tcb2 transposase n=1 Tax=Larimichthys crocea TaxID=215358 RepID=A0A0F8AP05_LARCR
MGDLYKVKEILTKEGYHSILQHHAIPCGRHLNGADFIVRQDNEHSSKLYKNYLEKKQSAGILSVMELPTQLPDLNPTELLWEQVDRMVRDLDEGRLSFHFATPCHTLWTALEWSRFHRMTRQ